MQLFKCYSPYIINSADECLVLWSKDETEARKICIDRVKSLDIYDDPEEFVNEEWIFEEHYPDRYSEVYVCVPNETMKADDIEIVFVPFYVFDVEEYVLDELAKYLSQEDYFRDHILDKAINLSFFERFLIYDEERWMDEVHKFFKGKPELANQYFNYILKDEELDEQFYFYVARKLINKEWLTFDIRKVETT